ncbi:hypothetical protein CRENBAI_018063 [Crenichthys baileyi]|uniref:Uncharacterized protein n=1 Tax=Crenichthys baileyi TaxID=28760 RepID=A0AAV9RQN4_9TELE
MLLLQKVDSCIVLQWTDVRVWVLTSDVRADQISCGWFWGSVSVSLKGECVCGGGGGGGRRCRDVSALSSGIKMLLLGLMLLLLPAAGADLSGSAAPHRVPVHAAPSAPPLLLLPQYGAPGVALARSAAEESAGTGKAEQEAAEHHHHDGGYRVVQWEWSYVQTPYIIAIWLLVASVAKIRKSAAVCESVQEMFQTGPGTGLTGTFTRIAAVSAAMAVFTS